MKIASTFIRFKLLFALTILFSLNSFAQSNFCGTDEFELTNASDSQQLFYLQHAHEARVNYYRKLLTDDLFINYSNLQGSGSSNCFSTRFVLPIVVHVIHHPSVPSSKIDTLQVQNQINELNKAFRNDAGGMYSVNTGIQFCFANRKPDSSYFNGIEYHQSTLSTHYKNTLQTLQDSFGFPPDKYINIYVVATIVDPPNNVLGYANYPYPVATSADGIVVRYNWFGDANSYTNSNSPLDALAEGKVLIHEMGHYLGLYHPFRDGCNGNDTSNCATRGDLCCDVPQVQNPNTSCVPINSCLESSNPIFDQLENYMDYTPENCKNTFTRNQASLMSSILLSVRSSLWQPENIAQLQLGCCQRSAVFSGDNIACQGEVIQFKAYPYSGNVTYSWKIYMGATLKASGNIINNNIWTTNALIDTGTYHVELSINFGSSTLVSDIPFEIQIVDCSKPIKDIGGNWYFGNLAGMKFYEGGTFRDLGPYDRKPNIETTNGSISISDTLGNLLFYAGSDKDKLIFYKSDYTVIYPGPNQIVGHRSAVQGAVALPYPGKPGKYLIVHNQFVNINESKPHYSVLNLNGTASFDSVNLLLRDNNNSVLSAMEGITALTACNDSTYWVLIPLYVGVGVNQTKIATFKVDNSGIYYFDQFSFNNKSTFNSQIEFSPNGRYFSLNRTIYLFNRKTGDITEFANDRDVTDEYVYGMSFSPNSNYLYRYVAYSDANKDLFDLYQLNLFSADLNKSKKYIAKSALFRTLQTGPDNKMYMSNYKQDFVSVLNSPNERVNAANETGYQIYGPTLAANGKGGQCESGLPNLIDAHKISKIDLDFDVKKTNCNNFTFIPNKCCASDYYWDFGDGGTSSSEIDGHVFSNKGTYTVKLKAGNDSIVKQVKIGNTLSELTVVGQTNICDTTLIYEYEVTMLPQYNYNFRASISTNLNKQSANSVSVKWQEADTLIIDLVNFEDGCVDTIKLAINKLPYELLSDSIFPMTQIKCKNENFDTLKANRNIIGTTYQWFKANGSEITPIANAINASYLPPTNSADSLYVLETKKGCNRTISSFAQAYSLVPTNNLVTQYPANIGQCKWGANGNEVVLPHAISKIYNWQYRIEHPQNGISNWSNIVNASQKDLLYNFSTRYDVELRRIANFYTCSDTSNIIPHYFGYVKEEPKDTNICFNSNFDYVLKLKHSTVQDYNLEVQWYKYDYGFRGITLSPFYLIKDTNYTNIDVSLKIRIDTNEKFTYVVQKTSNHLVTGCFHTSLHYFDVSTSKSSPQIISHPLSLTVNNGSAINLIVTAISNSSNFYQWYVSPDSTNWTPLHGQNNSTLYFSTAQKCQDGLFYRVKIMNACGTVNSYAAKITVIGGTTLNYDLWMKDSNKDIGAEPNTNISDYTLDVFRSPDVWNCDSNGNCLTHQDAEFKYLSNNTARVKIRNKGLSSSTGGILKIYWTLGSTGEIWDSSWLNLPQNTFFNADSGKYFPKGGEITPNGGITIPSVLSGDSVILNQSWNPPNPDWYYIIKDNSKIYNDKVTVCLYARIEDCNTYGYGMTFKEEYNKYIWTNTTKNNNIATRNFSSYNKVKTNLTIPTDWVGIGRSRLLSPSNRLKIRPDSTGTLDNFDVYVEMDDRLAEVWIAGGKLGNDFVEIYPGYVQLIGDEFELTNILLDQNEMAFFRLVFVPKVPLNQIPFDLFTVAISQFEGLSIEPDGGYIIEINNLYGTLDQQQYKRKVEKEKLDWQIRPNPASSLLYVAFDLPMEKKLEIAVFDLTGRRIQTIESQMYRKGIQSVNFDVAAWAKGVYFIQFKYDNYIESKKVVIQR